VVRIVVVFGALLSAVIGVLGLVAPGALLGILGHPGEHVSASSQQLAAYVGARELPIAVMLVVLLFVKSNRALLAVMTLFAAANALDAIDALVYHRWAQLPGAVAFALIFVAAALWLLRQPRNGEARS
jgi:hypothetical protein